MATDHGDRAVAADRVAAATAACCNIPSKYTRGINARCCCTQGYEYASE